MKIIVKSFIAITFLISIVLLGGCGFKDLDKRFFVVSIGVDQAKNSPKKYKISLKFAIPAVKDKPSDFIIVSENADTMGEAVRILKTKVDREIDFSHTKAIIFGDEIIKETGHAGINYWFTRRRDIQGIAWVAIGKPSAEAVLKVKPKSETLPSNSLFLALGKEGSETPYVIPQFQFDYKKKLIERGLDPVLPIIEARKDIFEINTVGLLNKTHLIRTLIPEETKLLNYLMNREKKSAFMAQTGKTKFIVNTDKVKTKFKIFTPKGKQPYIRVDVSLKGAIEETSRRLTNEQLSSCERAAEKEMNKSVKALLVKIQKADVDPLGFGLRYRARSFNKNDWDEWKGIYPTITFKVHSKVQITDTGIIQ